jgi:hypothetical protein
VSTDDCQFLKIVLNVFASLSFEVTRVAQKAEYEWKTSHILSSSRAWTPFENNSAHIGESGFVFDSVIQSLLRAFASLSFEVTRRADTIIRMEDVTSPK